MSAAAYDMTAARWEPFLFSIDFEEDVDWSDAVFAMDIRRFPDTAGDALVSLSTDAEGDEGISCTAETRDVDVDGVTVSMSVSTVTIQIDEATINALPFTSPRGGDVELYYDLVVTPDGGAKTRVIEGKFVVHAGVTQPAAP